MGVAERESGWSRVRSGGPREDGSDAGTLDRREPAARRSERRVVGSASASERDIGDGASLGSSRGFGIRPADPNAQVGALSGGNAQKVLLARELSRSLEVLAVAQPTRGVDLGAAAEIHQAIFAARESGVAILLVSSDLDELRLLADRIIVMRSGLVVGELPASDATDDRLGAHSACARRPVERRLRDPRATALDGRLLCHCGCRYDRQSGHLVGGRYAGDRLAAGCSRHDRQHSGGLSGNDGVRS